jgi:hypothetical protein
MDWKKRYARSQKENHFDIQKIKESLETVIKDLNKVLDNEGVSQASIDNDLISFPSCFISYKINPNNVEVIKHSKNNISSIQTSVIISHNSEGYYKLNYSDDNYEDLNTQLFDDILKRLLFKKI